MEKKTKLKLINKKTGKSIYLVPRKNQQRPYQKLKNLAKKRSSKA